jgi:flagellar basal body P-ring protein FlgI
MTTIARQLADYMRDQSPVTIDLNATRYETRQQVSKALRALVIAREAELCQHSK